MITILFLAAEPTDAARLRLGEEVREIRGQLQMAKAREIFNLQERFAVRVIDIVQALLDLSPQIVHFSGHGQATGAICVEDESGQLLPVAPEDLAALFQLPFTNQVECVVLNACYSEAQAHAIGKHIDFVIGVNQSIDDRAAIAFSVGFYQALGAGRSIPESHKIAYLQMKTQGVPDHMMPNLVSGRARIGEAARALNKSIADASFAYCRMITGELLENLARSSEVLRQPPVNLTAQWKGMIGGGDQLIDIKQIGSTVHLEGTSFDRRNQIAYRWRGEGRVVLNTLVFFWEKDDGVRGINIMTVSSDATTLEGRFYTCIGDQGAEGYRRLQ